MPQLPSPARPMAFAFGLADSRRRAPLRLGRASVFAAFIGAGMAWHGVAWAEENLEANFLTPGAEAQHVSSKSLSPLLILETCLFACFWRSEGMVSWREEASSLSWACSSHILFFTF